VLRDENAEIGALCMQIAITAAAAAASASMTVTHRLVYAAWYSS